MKARLIHSLKLIDEDVGSDLLKDFHRDIEALK